MKIVLAYSGGLDTSVILSWIKERYDAEIIAFCANIGQEEELKGLEAKAKGTGASKCYIADLQEEFARDFIFPMMQAGAIYESQYLLGTSIARPLIAKGMIEVAKQEKAEIHWGDETAIHNDAYNVKGFASKGKTPIVRLTTKRCGICPCQTVS